MFSKKIIVSIFLLFLNVVYLNAKPEGALGFLEGVRQPIELRPYQAIVHSSTNICGGVILSNYWIITIAYCTYQSSPYEIYVGVGAQELESLQEYYGIADVIIHPNYNSKTFNNNIALLKTNRNIEFSDIVYTIDLETNLPPVGSLVKTSGYGFGVSRSTHSLMNAVLFISDFDQCNRVFSNRLTENSMFCASVVNYVTDQCIGDSGSPVTFNEKLVGLVSFGIKDCADDNFPGVFTSIPFYLSWINEIMATV